ncbi:hypothetical protein CQR47_0203 [Bifidobacterium thermophilum]|uniref:Uncharacterized protein n=1 Tax=Bifidobacterium thermophilum TaxID=33905 RepID=A0A2N3QP26_9BIFI|nr:hypothetical protein CQR48_0257 [Bifidobacterium thermophilum]PKU93429.1 hypothetical protein CQR47_0203 [Bifidobacterium thermophilum]
MGCEGFAAYDTLAITTTMMAADCNRSAAIIHVRALFARVSPSRPHR